MAAALLLGLHLAPSASRAEDRILLSEVLPALDGTDLGTLELGSAPPPGGARMVRRSEVLHALRRAGRSPEGLAIPASTRVRRGAQELDTEAIEKLGQSALEEALAPCQVEEVRWPSGVRTAEGELDIRAEAQRPSRSGSVSATLILDSRGRSTRVPLRAQVTCPPPVLQPGSRVQIVVENRHVRASAPGEARQPGRIGDIIRVTNLLSRHTVRAEVVNGETVRLFR